MLVTIKSVKTVLKWQMFHMLPEDQQNGTPSSADWQIKIKLNQQYIFLRVQQKLTIYCISNSMSSGKRKTIFTGGELILLDSFKQSLIIIDDCSNTNWFGLISHLRAVDYNHSETVPHFTISYACVTHPFQLASSPVGSGRWTHVAGRLCSDSQ